MKNKRQYFRHQFHEPLCGEIQIIAIEGKKVDSKKGNICIKNIGAGGLLFETPLSFPQTDFLFRFYLQLAGTSVQIDGKIIRREKVGENSYQYGVKFWKSNMQEQEMVSLINRVDLKGRRANYEGCLVCSKHTDCPKKHI